MAQRRDDTPSVATYADHEVITPPHALRKMVSQVSDGEYEDPVARAEAALVELASEFSDWMQAECDRLEAARKDVARIGFTEKTHDALFRAAHDIKGEAATFGYPEVAGVAESLCRLLEHTPETARIPLKLVDQHVDAVRAIIREHARPDLADAAGALTRRLREVTDEFLKRENRHRPDYLDNIFSPPLVPGAIPGLRRRPGMTASQAAADRTSIKSSVTSSSQNSRASSRAASVAKRRSSVNSGAISLMT
jgi:chemotaxis protein histidine kinase CheA